MPVLAEGVYSITDGLFDVVDETGYVAAEGVFEYLVDGPVDVGDVLTPLKWLPGPVS